MTLEEISSMWFEDAHINVSKLHEESLRIPLLHQKYYDIYIEAKLTVSRMKEELKKFEVCLEEYMTGSMGSEEIEKFVELATKKKIILPDLNKKVLKPDVPKKIASNSYVIQQNLKIADMTEKADYLKSILAMISGRSFQIRDAVEFIKFQAGN